MKIDNNTSFKKEEKNSNSSTIIKIGTKSLMISLIKHRKKDYFIIPDYLCFIDFLYKSLKESGLLPKYEIAFDVNIFSLKRSVDYNDDLFKDEILYEDRIYLRNPNKLDYYVAKYCDDAIIEKYINKYCNEKIFEQRKHEYNFTRNQYFIDQIEKMKEPVETTIDERYPSLTNIYTEHLEIQSQGKGPIKNLVKKMKV